MKSALKFFVLFLSSLALLTLRVPTAFAYCHILSDPTGDAGSSLAFADIVSSELSNEADSIGVRITTNGNIPNGFGTTGVMIFGVVFPASLLSGDANDSGVNFVTVHWKEDGSGWEGSQFIYRDDLQSTPWNANISINGKTAFFKIPKSLIGKGTIAYQVHVGFISEEGESSDVAPHISSFSDCYVVQKEQPAATPQIGGVTESKPSPKLEASTPKREGNKVVEKPGVVRVSDRDVGGSFVLSSPSPAAREESLTKPKTLEASPVGETTEQPSLLADMAVIGVVGLVVISAAYFLLRGKAGGKAQVGGDPLPKLLYWRYLRQFGRKILASAGFSAGPGAGGGGGGPCKDGDIRNIHLFKCKFLFLDPNLEIKIETEKWFEGSALQAKRIASWLAHVDVGTKGQATNPRFQPWFLKVKEIQKMLAGDKNAHTRNKELARQFKVVYVEIPVQWRIDDCVDWEVCLGGVWHKRRHYRLTYVLTKLRIDAKKDSKYKLHAVTFDDFPEWLEELLKQFPASVEPCDC